MLLKLDKLEVNISLFTHLPFQIQSKIPHQNMLFHIINLSHKTFPCTQVVYEFQVVASQDSLHE